MGNKYGSNIRTYTARNLVWNVSGVQPIPFVMNAPAPLTIPLESMLQVFYKAQFPSQNEWNRESKIAIKRAGIFCNFADGLVQKMDTSRVTMTVSVLIARYDMVDHSDCSFVKGSNKVTGVNLQLLSSTPPDNIIFDNTNLTPYYVQKAPAVAGGDLYITDYARYTQNIVFTSKKVVQQLSEFTIFNIATLNNMYETELFFPYCPVEMGDTMYLSCKLGIDGSDTSLDFYTKSINPDFNGSPVSFDSVIELEITPS